MAGNLCLLTQFMSFQEPHFLLTISWILRLKNECFIVLTIFRKLFQSSRLLVSLYLSKSLLQLSFYQLLEYLVILTIFEFFSQAHLTTLVNLLTTLSRLSLSDKLEVWRFLIEDMKSLINDISFSLSLMIDLFLELIYSLLVEMVILREVWSDVRHQSG